MASQLTAADVRALADKVAADTARMQRQSTSQLRIYAVVGIALVLYLAWAFHRIAVFIEPGNLAERTGDIAIGQAKEIIGQMGDSGQHKAPELVADAEDAVLNSMPQLREQLETTMRTTVAKLVKETLEGTDQALVEEMAKVPDASKLLVSAQKKPADLATLYAEAQKRVLQRPEIKGDIADAMTELNTLRDHLRKLRENRTLTPSERAERRLLQVVLANVPMPEEPLTSPVAKAPAAVSRLK